MTICTSNSKVLLLFLIGTCLDLALSQTAPPTRPPLPLGCNALVACLNPDGCSIMKEEPPPQFQVIYRTNVGDFPINVVTKWSPKFATRMWQLSRLRYMEGGRFYRVDSKSFINNGTKIPPFVIQFGLRGAPQIDTCWSNKMNSNQPGGPVIKPGNMRGYVSFSMGAQFNKTKDTPYCKYPSGTSYCAIGFSNQIFINLGDNSAKLDPPGFSIFGKIPEAGMKVVDKIYKEYGDVKALCGKGSTNPYCNGTGAKNKGVNMDLLSKEGNVYLKAKFPKMSYINQIQIRLLNGTLIE